MRLVLVVAVVAMLSAPTAAAEIDPESLVLESADVPAGFRLDRDESGVRTNARESKDSPEARDLIVRSGRITGYETSWEKRAVTFESRADLCRRSAGARILFDFVVLEMRKAGIKGLRRADAGLGTESRIYWGGRTAGFTLVVWRYDRVFAGVVGVGLTRAQALDLARAQQRRIADALR